ncbi:protein YAE1 homolog isoform X1 [Sceloporus undulatus]|uniref:protein YAE1 homolog isoform X1 n=1 Tax=Sceloporus undulatus TaxID=8520 RepID=UPI001C4ABB17|nr:protein YAE1 homolog isoform X1 [Sceloporus undulatus]
MSWVRPWLSSAAATTMTPLTKIWMDGARPEGVEERQGKRVQEGYREGIEAGKKVTLQEGFNQGYKEAARMMFSCGQLKGTLSALSSWCQHNGCNSTTVNEVTELLNELRTYEEYVLKDFNHTQPQTHVGDLQDTIEAMDLGHTCSGTTTASICENGTAFSGHHCRNNSGTDSVQGECCRKRKEGRDFRRPSLTSLKEKIVCLVEKLGLNSDTIGHIHLLQT